MTPEVELCPPRALKYVHTSRNKESTDTLQWPHFFFETASHYVAMPVSNLQRSASPCLPNAKSMCHDTQQ